MWWIWEILDKYPALVRYYSGGLLLRVRVRGAFLCIRRLAGGAGAAALA